MKPIKPLTRTGVLWLAVRVYACFLADTVRDLFLILFTREGPGPMYQYSRSPVETVMWHRWFAWHPVYVNDGYFCWGMRFVWRAGKKQDGKWISRMYSSIKPVK